LAAGNFITIGQGSGQQVDRIATVSGTTLTLYNPLESGYASGDPVALQSVGVTFAPALNSSHNVGENAIDTGTAITLTQPVAQGHPAGDTFIHQGTGVTLVAPLTKTHLPGANTSISTSLAAAATSGATNLKVANVTNLAAGDQLTVGQAGYSETVTIQ